MPIGPGALAGLRIVELGGGIAAPYATKMLADYGADVIKVEPPEGDPARGYGPFPGDEPHPEKSGLFIHLNTNKRGITLDLESPEAESVIAGLAGWADAVVESFGPGYLASRGLSYERLQATNPRLVLTSITPFGQDGPYSHWHATEMVLFAMSGRMYGHGRQEREPMRYAPDLVCFQAGTTAAAATAAALWGTRIHGTGTWIDLSVQEALIGNVDSRVVMASYSGVSGGRSYRVQEYPRGAYPCKDGFVLFGSGSDRYFQRLCRVMGRPDLLEDPRWSTAEARPAHRDAWEAAFLDWSVDRTRQEVFQVCQAAGVLCAPVLTPGEVPRDPQFLFRGAFKRTEHPVAGEVVLPGAPFVLPGAPWAVRRPAPGLGEHTEEVYRELVASEAPPPFEILRSAAPPRPRPPLPQNDRGALAGIRVIDCAEVWAGPMGMSIMADLGAEVVKVESFPRAPLTRPTSRRVGLYGFAGEGEDPPRPWDRSATHNLANRNKYGIALNAREPEGLGLFRRLASVSDVLVDGYAAGVMERLGMGYETLRRENPGLIMVSMPGWGSTGPYKGYVSLGSTVDATVGHHYLRTYPDADPSQSPACTHSDAVAAVTLVVAVMTALFHRLQTGEGQWIDLSQAEALLPHLAHPLMDHLMNGRVAEPLGNHDRTMAPHSCYPCRGQDDWIVICVESEAQWRALCAVAGQQDWETDPRFCSREKRYRNQDALDGLIGQWTRGHEKGELAALLQEVDVPAAPVLKEMEVLADPHLAARGFFQEVDNKVIGPRLYPGPLWCQRGLDPAIRSGPNTLGEHNRLVARDLLGYSRDECVALEAGGVLGDAYRQDAAVDHPGRRASPVEG